MAVVTSFRAVRYDEEQAGPLETLVAPPYDVISPQEREEYLARSPYNVVHLTLPDSEQDAGRLWQEWLARGVLVREDMPAVWELEQDFVGPDGYAYIRRGLVVSLRAEPYESEAVLPHERTHAAPKEERLRLLREVATQLEPIFLLYDGPPPVSTSKEGREPDLAVEGAKLWRLPDISVEDAFTDGQLLIADGHHRYETALAYHQETGTPESAFVMAVLVSTSDPGLTIFPTHRLFRSAPGELDGVERRPAESAEAAVQELEHLQYERSAAVAYTGGRTELLLGGEDELDVQLVDRLGHEGIGYTPTWEEAVRAVDSGEAAAAYLLRPTRIEDVFATARAGQVLPPKTTYFFPKLVSGLLFHPL